MGFDVEFAIIGHRGAAGLAPENTLPSFRRAFELGVDAIELDVHVVEGVLVVIHDEELDRTTNGQGRVDATTLAELRALDAGAGEAIPTLAEVIAITPPEVGINVELKGESTASAAAAMLADSHHDTLVSSFDHDELGAFAAHGLPVRLAPLFSRYDKTALDVAAALGAWSVNLGNRRVRRRDVTQVRDAGFHVYVYTVNDSERAAELRGWGVNGVFTDYPDRVRA